MASARATPIETPTPATDSSIGDTESAIAKVSAQDSVVENANAIEAHKAPALTRVETADNTSDEEDGSLSPISLAVDGSAATSRSTLEDHKQSRAASTAEQGATSERKPSSTTSTSPDLNPAFKAEAEAEAEADIEAERNSALHRQRSKISKLKSQISALQDEALTTRSELKDPNAAATIARHIRLLHEYNAIRDVGLGLMGMVADRRGVRVGEVLEEFGLQEGD